MIEFFLWVSCLAQASLLIYLAVNFRFVRHRQAKSTASLLALLAHKDQKDKAGEDYIWHLDRVVRGVKGDSAKIVAWLHDIVEDGYTTHKDLKSCGLFKDTELYALRLLDKNCVDGLSFAHHFYIKEPEFGRTMAISEVPLAREVKISDLKDNLDATRFLKAGIEITDRDRRRFKRYQSQLSYLEDV